jgi:hypothetical protein
VQTKKKLLGVTSLAIGALCLTVSAAQADARKTTIKINGQFATVFLVDPAAGINGDLTASKDNVANTSALDFLYEFANPANPEQIIRIIGAGTIPNDAFTITNGAHMTAQLSVTVSDSPPSFSLQSCIVDLNAGTVDCSPTSPESFAFTWTANGFATVDEKTGLTQTFGPVTEHVQGEFLSQSADSAGTWAGHTNADSASRTATLSDTHNTDVTRDITVPPNN